MIISYICIVGACIAMPPPEIASEGGILMDARTGKILYEKNGLTTFYPASTTKILTSMILVESFVEEDILTKSVESIKNVPGDSSHIGLIQGERYSYEDGLHAILMGSDNFVAYDMARFNSATIQDFADKMNQKLER